MIGSGFSKWWGTSAGGGFDTSAFVITVKTDNVGTSGNNEFLLPLYAGLTYNAVINWGDGNTTIQNTDVSPTHTYSTPGTYQIQITGTFPSIAFFGTDDCLKLLSVDNWGDVVWETFDGMFYGCANMIANYSDQLDTEGVLSFSSMLQDCTAFNAPISYFNVSLANSLNDIMTGKTDADYTASYLDDIYNIWTNSSLQLGQTIGFGTIKRTSASTAARGLLTRASATRTVTSCVDNGSGLIRITTSVVHGRTTGDKVFVSGILGCVEANGGWIVTVISTTVIDLQGSAFVNARTGGGTVRTGYGWTVTDGGI